ncbi:MAG: prolipoprotein diacylglyceryl transferase [Propionibacteriaceae bacterium]|nr:prolipoprotein diacylglyceryl transferase [Propionibacteriaceae bacterium]
MDPLVLHFPNIDPVAFRLGPLTVYWYAVMYLVGFALGYVLLRQRLKHAPFNRIVDPKPWTRDSIEDLLFIAMLGVILGGRLGYCLFYKPAYYFANPLEILYLWEGGMSFHGGALGVILGMLLYAWRVKRPLLEVADFLVPAVPTGLAAGRLGNFINGELWGRVASPDLPWAMIFPGAGPDPRHPSQIYQFLGEGLLLAVLLWAYARRERPRGAVSAAFLVGYGVFRFVAEFFREPDDFLGRLGFGMTMGQWLSLPMIVAGIVLWLWARRFNLHPPIAERSPRHVAADSSEEPESATEPDEPKA